MTKFVPEFHNLAVAGEILARETRVDHFGIKVTEQLIKSELSAAEKDVGVLDIPGIILELHITETGLMNICLLIKTAHGGGNLVVDGNLVSVLIADILQSFSP